MEITLILIISIVLLITPIVIVIVDKIFYIMYKKHLTNGNKKPNY